MNRGHFPSDEAVIKLLWLAICDIEDKRARERDKEKGLPASKRRAKGKLVEGQITTDWNKALAQPRHRTPRPIRPLPIEPAYTENWTGSVRPFSCQAPPTTPSNTKSP